MRRLTQHSQNAGGLKELGCNLEEHLVLRILKLLSKRNKRGSGQLVKSPIVLRRRSAADRLKDAVATAARLGIMHEIVRKIKKSLFNQILSVL